MKKYKELKLILKNVLIECQLITNLNPEKLIPIFDHEKFRSKLSYNLYDLIVLLYLLYFINHY